VCSLIFLVWDIISLQLIGYKSIYSLMKQLVFKTENVSLLYPLCLISVDILFPTVEKKLLKQQ